MLAEVEAGSRLRAASSWKERAPPKTGLLGRTSRGLILAHQAVVALDHRIGRQRKQDHQALDRQRFHGRIEADRGQERRALDLGDRDDRLFLEFLHGLADELDRHRKQERRGDDEQRPQRQLPRDQVDEIEQHGKADRRGGKAGKQACAPAALGLRERVDEQHGLGAFAEHRKEGQRADRPYRILRQRLIGLVREIFLPAARILLHHQPAADVEHQGGGKQNDKAFQDIAVVARVQHRKQPGRNKAGADGGERAGIERLECDDRRRPWSGSPPARRSRAWLRAPRGAG